MLRNRINRFGNDHGSIATQSSPLSGDLEATMLRICVLVFACLIFSGCEKSDVPATLVDLDNKGVAALESMPPINRQVEYETTPRYCIVAIGPNREKQMWFVIDHHTLYVDLNSNGDLTEPNERFAGEVEMSYDGTTFVNYFVGDLEFGDVFHTDTNVRAALTDNSARASINLYLDGFVGSANNSHVLQLEMSANPDLASVVHFGGPVTMGLYEEPQSVTAGEEIKFYGLVGTSGDGVGTLTAIAHETIPAEFHPRVEFSFPHRDLGQPNIEVATYLKERC